MKYHEIIALLTEEPLLVTHAAHASLVKLFEEHRTLSAEAFKAAREGVDLCGEVVELDQMEVVDGIAFIPIGGPIGRGLGKFEKGAGAVDVADIEEDIDEAEDDDEVEAILLDIDSPGGMVSGTPELADRIARCQKPIYAFSGGLMCSAAYWLAAACDGIFCTKSADIGNVGVYTAFLDSSERMKMEGLKVDVISSGKYKGAGVPGAPLSDDHRQHMQDRINEIASMFYDHVQTNRPDVKSEDMQGQAFKGPSALAKGLVDQVVDSRDDVVAILKG